MLLRIGDGHSPIMQSADFGDELPSVMKLAQRKGHFLDHKTIVLVMAQGAGRSTSSLLVGPLLALATREAAGCFLVTSVLFFPSLRRERNLALDVAVAQESGNMGHVGMVEPPQDVAFSLGQETVCAPCVLEPDDQAGFAVERNIPASCPPI